MDAPDIAILAHHDVPGPQALALAAAARRRGASSEVWSPRTLAVEIDDRGSRVLSSGSLVQPGVVLPQGINRSFAFCAQALGVLEEHGCRVVNAVAPTAISLDKVATTRRLATCGIPILPTQVYPWGARQPGSPPWPDPHVTKPAHGSNGEGVQAHEDAFTAHTWLTGDRDLGSSGTVGTELLQPLAHGAGSDLRVHVLQAHAVATIRRHAKSGFVTNGMGSTSEAADEPEAAALAVRAVTALGLDYGAVDIIAHDGRYVVLEVNCWPRDLEWAGAQCGVDLIGNVIDVALANGAT